MTDHAVTDDAIIAAERRGHEVWQQADLDVPPTPDEPSPSADADRYRGPPLATAG
jgi:hypothetical protein